MNKMSERPKNASTLYGIKNRSPCNRTRIPLYISRATNRHHTDSMLYATCTTKNG